ncbi:acetylornithine/succinylornithine aminotransferase [Neokomagataea thailandica NBRC 106555]|uniref:Aspartate aminotransferase family protein n=2 Tax=Neokomagataea TaxID=1223423 RepID=A0A4Y6V6E8_9PROT|nr:MULTISPECIES: aspartate aminotransferase family protein [Neokomagataea]QDH24418.1 aspartate aminotransferase family protein [Neokomagataea tanensis]GBR50865.1 acetylornithine/succinylornithine aminotransferase [Neokomagataea thailandica NBRC 106555]
MISALMPNYNRADLAFEQGQGIWLQTADGRRFMDFGAGIAVSSLGHAHPKLVHAIAEQAGKVMHVSNLYRVPQAERLADLLVQNTFADSVLFCNSGAEANEGMVKMIRRAQFENGHPERTRILCFDGAFHGRTLAMIAAGGNPAYLKGFGPVVEGFDHIPFNNTNTLRDAITPETAGIIVEPIQGETGIKTADVHFMKALRAVCDEFGLYLGFDEVQTGVGRTGKLFAHEWSGIAPDVMSVAKGIGGGFPLGAVLATEAVAKHMTPGSHGTTFGGNPLACAAGTCVMTEILAPGFIQQVEETGHAFGAMLQNVVERSNGVFDGVRGLGLMRGLHCTLPVGDVLSAVINQGLLAVTAGDNVLRLVPPLIVTPADCQMACDRLIAAALSFSPAKGDTNKEFAS